MVKLQPIETPFTAEQVATIRRLQASYAWLRPSFHPSRRFIEELIRSLEAGNLVAALLLAATALEMIVRETAIADRIREAQKPRLSRGLGDRIDQEVESTRDLSFPRLVDELVNTGRLNEHESGLFKPISERIRIPLHHGLTYRYLAPRSHAALLELEADFAQSRAMRGERFGEALDESALKELDEVLQATELIVKRACAV